MTTSVSFSDLIRRVRAGEEDAAAEVVRSYEPAIRRAVRFRLANSGLSRLMDSVDLSQLVMASFFFRASAGQFDIEDPAQLMKLLVAIARNKLAMHARAQHRQCRDQRRSQDLGDANVDIASSDPSPSQHVAGQELLQVAQQLLTAEERTLVELRKQGLEWREIADQVGGTPEGLRKKLSRAVDAVAHRLELDSYSHD